MCPMRKNGKYIPFFSKDAYKALELDGLLRIPINMQFDNFYDKNGNYEFSYTFENAKSKLELLKHYVNDYMWN